MDTTTADIQKPHPRSLLYADDVFLADASRQQLQQQTQLWNDRLQLRGLKVNPANTAYIESGTQTDGTIAIDATQLKKTSEFKYLGSTITADGDITAEVRAHVKAAWLKWRQVTGVLCDRRMPTRFKAKIYRTVVRPVALYGCECWPAGANNERALRAMEMCMLRWNL